MLTANECAIYIVQSYARFFDPKTLNQPSWSHNKTIKKMRFCIYSILVSHIFARVQVTIIWRYKEQSNSWYFFCVFVLYHTIILLLSNRDSLGKLMNRTTWRFIPVCGWLWFLAFAKITLNYYLMYFRWRFYGRCNLWFNPTRATCCGKAFNVYDGLPIRQVRSNHPFRYLSYVFTLCSCIFQSIEKRMALRTKLLNVENK